MQTMPVIMSFDVLDSNGCIGLQADIEATSYLGCHCTPIATAIAHSTDELCRVTPLATTLMIQQARNVLQRISISVFKVGMLCDVEHVVTLSTIIRDYPHIPVILDPQLEHCKEQQTSEMSTVLRETLCNQATLVIAQQLTAHWLAPHADTLEACAQDLMGQGAEHVLLSKNNQFTLYSHHRQLEQYPCSNINTAAKGVASAFSASLCAYLAHGLVMTAAIREAQSYAWTALHNAYNIGLHEPILRRCPSLSNI